MKKLILAFAIVLFTVGTLTGCETTEGVGRDVENLGDEVQRLG